MTLRHVGAGELDAWVPAIAAVYRDAFGVPPFNEGEGAVRWFVDQLPRTLGRRGTRLLCWGTPEATDGFAFGYPFPGSWAGQIRDQLAGDAWWVEDAFYVQEVAVLAERRGSGIGTALLDALLEGLPHRTAVLTTHVDAVRARAFYVARGWTPIRDRLQLFGNPHMFLGLAWG